MFFFLLKNFLYFLLFYIINMVTKMNENIINDIVNNLNIKKKQVTNTLSLLEDGNTIPFISRYRKEATGGLNEVQIKEVSDVYNYQVNLLKRKEDVIRLIDEKGLLTDELKSKILSCEKLIDVEDLYRPYKEKKKTKASDAIAKGLEELAKIIMSFPLNKTPLELSKSFKCDKETDDNKKLEGASYIIAEYISDNASFRKYIRNYILKNGTVISKVKKNCSDDNKTYEMYYDYSEKVSIIKPHRILALNRGEKEGVLNVSIDIDDDYILNYLSKKVIKNESSLVKDFVLSAINDSYKRLIFPSIEREIRSILSLDGEDAAIKNFSLNVGNLLMTPPLKDVVVLGFDPAFRTGCKLAVLDKQGNVLHIDKIYPHEPVNDKINSKNKVLSLIDKYNIDVIAIGNGTASRESELFISELLKECSKPCKYIIVSEAGASIYSASKLAIDEFPNLDVSERSAISIGRRLQDPLSELVKIDPKGIGVGLYQHDVPSKKLDESLSFEISNIVNNIGVSINTASSAILSYISGLTKSSIEKILSKRKEIGKFSSRDEIRKIKGISDKVYEQSIGFIRIIDGTNPLDKTNIHPESYEKTYKLLNKLNLSVNDLGKESIKNALEKIDIDSLSNELDIDKFTLEDIINSLKKPVIDPRDSIEKPILRSDILTIDDLSVGMKLQGTVRNVVDFGAFVDIGLHDDGLIHISKMSDGFIKHPLDILSVGDIIDCYVIDIDKNKNRVSLSLKEL